MAKYGREKERRVVLGQSVSLEKEHVGGGRHIMCSIDRNGPASTHISRDNYRGMRLSIINGFHRQRRDGAAPFQLTMVAFVVGKIGEAVDALKEVGLPKSTQSLRRSRDDEAGPRN